MIIKHCSTITKWLRSLTHCITARSSAAAGTTLDVYISRRTNSKTASTFWMKALSFKRNYNKKKIAKALERLRWRAFCSCPLVETTTKLWAARDLWWRSWKNICHILLCLQWSRRFLMSALWRPMTLVLIAKQLSSCKKHVSLPWARFQSKTSSEISKRIIQVWWRRCKRHMMEC